MKQISWENVDNQPLVQWLQEVEALCEPRSMQLIEGDDNEYAQIADQLVLQGVLTPLNPSKRPGSFLARSAQEDVARVESRTFICTEDPSSVGPTNNWEATDKMKERLKQLFKGSMSGRDCYIIPFCMGHPDSPLAQIGVQITDSAYVVLNTFHMTRMGSDIWQRLSSQQGGFIPCWHSVGVPLKDGETGPTWPCSPEQLVVAHFPKEREIWSFGSGYGGNALLGKKCLALRIASAIAKEEGWLAEHMLIMGLRSPDGEKKYIAAAFPSACGKTNLAMLKSPIPGWEIECVGDDIAWMHFDKQGKLRAINPEAGFFGVAPGTSTHTNPVAMQTIAKNTLFTNVALSSDHDVWWEGLGQSPTENLIDWKGNIWDKKSPAAHPNARFTVSIEQCPIFDAAWNDPQGVVIDAIVFGGRRSSGMPLVMQADSWESATLFGAALSSEKTAAASGGLGQLRHDPFAMLPFCGYHMGDYFSHWLSLKQPGRKMPAVFYVNWFSKDENGKFLWPGFGENMRVLKWIFERSGKEDAPAISTPIGLFPDKTSFDLDGIHLSDTAMEKLFELQEEHWQAELQKIEEYFQSFGEKMPPALLTQVQTIRKQILAGATTPQ